MAMLTMTIDATSILAPLCWGLLAVLTLCWVALILLAATPRRDSGRSAALGMPRGYQHEALAGKVALLALALVVPSFAHARASHLRCGSVELREYQRFERNKRRCLRVAAVRPPELDEEACDTAARARLEHRLAKAGCLGGDVTDLNRGIQREHGSALVDLGGVAQDVEYDVIDGQAIFQEDIVLGPADVIGAGRIDGGSAQSGTRPSATWISLRIPYESGFMDNPNDPNDMASRIQAAVGHWNVNTMIRLVPRNGEADYVRLQSKMGVCQSAVGKQGGRQLIELGACSTGNIIHEIGHAIGLWHEQSRRDRDSYVQVHWNAIEEGKEHNFYRYSTSEGVDRGPFDFSSIMLYSSYDFAKSKYYPTLTKINGNVWTYNKTTLSTGDIAGVTLMIVAGRPRLRFLDNMTGFCLSGKSATQADCATADQWVWYRHPTTNRNHIVNVRTGQCLSALSSAADAALTTRSCSGGLSQSFARTPKAWPGAVGTFVEVKSALNGLCMGVAYSEKDIQGAAIRLQTCTSTPSSTQVWREM